MPTLNELLGLSVDPDLLETKKLESYFTSEPIKPQPQSQGQPQNQSINRAVNEPINTNSNPLQNQANDANDKNYLEGAGKALWETTGLPAYAFVNTALFDVPGVIAKKALGTDFYEDYLTPQTTAGRVGTAVGGTLGFVYGAPMKLGAKAVRALAKPLIKKIGSETVEQVTKKSVKQIVKSSHKNQFGGEKVKFVEETFGKSIGSMSHKARWASAGESVSKNWVRTSSKAIDEIAANAVAVGKLTAKEAALVAKTFKKNVGNRPLQDIVDVVMKRNPNKFGYIVGSMIQEGAMFGMIDAVMEGSHSLKEDRPYDYTAPLWGVLVGSAFGALKLLPAAGKASITSQDFKAGVKTLFAKDFYGKMSAAKLISNAKIIGESRVLKDGSDAATIFFKGKHIDLTNPIMSIGKGKAKSTEILRAAMRDQQKKYGKEMMVSAVKEDFKSTLANWKRVIAGTAIMNIRTSIDIAAGHEMLPEDIMTSLMIGAFINRKGTPLTPDINMKQMAKMRRNINFMGVPQTRQFEINALEVPTMHASQTDHINPLNDVAFIKTKKIAEKTGLVGPTPESVETSSMELTNSPSLAVSQKNFPLFNRYYEYINAVSPGKYIKPKALVTEAEAIEIQNSLKEINFENTNIKINSVQDFDNIMLKARDKMTDDLEYQIAKTAKDITYDLGWGELGNPSGELGTIPRNIKINMNLENLIVSGKIDGLKMENVLNSLGKVQKILNTLQKTTKGQKTQDRKLGTMEIVDEAQLRRVIEFIAQGEQNINDAFGSRKKQLDFDFNALEEVDLPLLKRRMEKGYESYENFFDDMVNPKWNTELIPKLKELGVIVKDTEATIGERRLEFENITVEHPEGFKGGNEEALLKTVMGILSAKGNQSLKKVDTRTTAIIPAEKVRAFEEYLNQNKIITQKDLLDAFRNDIIQKIHFGLVKQTKIKESDVMVLDNLAGLGLPFAHYSTLSDGGSGFSVSKIHPDSIPKDKRNKYYKAAVEYNTKVDNIMERSKTPKGKQFITPDRLIKVRDKNDLIMLKNIIDRSVAKSQAKGIETVINIVKTLDPDTTLGNAVQSYLETSKNADRFINFMVGEGLIAPSKKKGTIEYNINVEKFGREDVKLKIEEFVGKFGFHTTDIQKMIDTAAAETDNILNSEKSLRSGAMSQQDFIVKYYSDGDGKSRYGQAEKQIKLFDNAIANKDPHKYLIKEMNLTINNKEVSGIELLKNRNTYNDKYIEVVNDVQKMLVLRGGSINVKTLSVTNSTVKETMNVMQRTPFINFLNKSNIPFVFVDGNLHTKYFANNNLRENKMNIFDLDSPHNDHAYNNPVQSKKMKKHFYDAIGKYTFNTGIKGSPESTQIKFIRLGNGKDVIAVPGNSYKEVAKLYKKEIYDPFIKEASGESHKKIEAMKKELDQLETWSDFHEDAMRSIIIKQMVTGAGDRNRFLRVLEGKDISYPDLGKRFSLFHTPSFKRMDVGLVKRLATQVDAADKRLLQKFANRKVGMITWNDDAMATVFQRNEKFFKKKMEGVKEMLGSREDVSSFDSISFISADFKRVLELYYGLSVEGSNVFKPIITSNGKDAVFFGKTVFIYDPDIQTQIFGKNKNLDILMTKSADKMKSSISAAEWNKLPSSQNKKIKYLDKSINQLLGEKDGQPFKDPNNLTATDIKDFMTTMDMSSIGITISPDKVMRAKQSYSIANYFNNAETTDYFNSFYKTKLENLIGSSKVGEGILQKLTQNSMYKRLALLKLKSGDAKTNLEDMVTGPESLQNLGHHLQIAAMGGDPKMLGENVLTGALKSKFIDPILSPKSETTEGEVYGGKAVIKQSFKLRNLKPTIRTNEGKDTEINPGDITLPHNSRIGSIDFKKASLELRAVGKNGEVKSLKDVMIQMWKDKAKRQEALQAQGIDVPKKINKQDFKINAENNWEYLIANGDLGMVHDALKRNTKDWDVGIITTRYPRTAPNDLAVLRLKGFLPKNHGNTAIVNDFDVMNIFEGDYDVDEVDFFWGMNKGGWSNINRSKQHWVNTKDPQYYEPKAPDLELLTGKSNANWNTFDANNRVLKRGIGIVQKTPRLLSHLQMIGVKNTTKGSEKEGMSQLIKYKNKLGEDIEIYMDYDNANFFQRSALESQLIIDYWKGVNPKIARGMVDWRNQYLFPLFNESIGKEQIKSLKERQANQALDGPNNKRVRLFRKYVEGKETSKHDLKPEEIALIKELMSQHSKFLSLTSEVYDGSGMGQTPDYNTLYDVSQKYFNGHLKDLNRNVFYKLSKKFADSEVLADMFTPVSVVKNQTNNKLKYYSSKKADEARERLEKDIALERQTKRSGMHTYRKNTTSPFLEGVIRNAQEISQQDGQNGSIMERVYREIYFKDPFGNDANQGKVHVPLTGELYVQLQAVSSELLNKHYTFGNSEQVRDIIPKLTKNFNEDVKLITSLTRLHSQVSNSKELSQNQKASRMKGIKEAIVSREEIMRDLLPKEYIEKRDIKLLEKIKVLDITHNEEIIEGTVQWMVLDPLADRFKSSNNTGFNKLLNKAFEMGAELYSEKIEMGSTSPYKGKQILNAKQEKLRSEPKEEYADIELEISKVLEEGYQDYKIPFLINYALPKKTSTTIGLFNNIPMPVSTKATGRFKRITKFLLEKMNTTKDPVERLEIKNSLKVLINRYNAYRNFFDGNLDMIPLKDRDMMNIINNAPGFSSALKNTFDRYESIKIDKGTQAKDVFGMGTEYDNNVSFFQRLVNEKAMIGSTIDFNAAEQIISKTNQLVMENGYLDPISYYLHTKNLKTKLEKLGLSDVEQASIETNDLSKLQVHGEAGLNILAGRHDGITIKPLAMLNDYRLGLITRMIKQGKDIKSHQKATEKSWKEERQQELKSGKCKPNNSN